MSVELTPNYRRSIEDVTRDIHAKTGEFLRAAIEIGRLLFEAKAMVAPGSWSKYIEEELPFSHSWANNYMKLYTAWGSDQTSLFGDSHAYMNLRPSQALELLRLPEGEREEFMATHDVESMSTRELNAMITELKATKADLQASEADLEEARAEIESLKDAAEEKTVRFEEARQEDEAKMRNLQVRLAAAEQAEKNAEESRRKLQEQLSRAEKAEKIALDALKKARENPDIPESMMEQLRREAEAKAAEEATAEIRKKLATAEAALQTAERNRTDAEAREKDARDKLAAAAGDQKMQNPDLMAINVLGKQILRLWATIKDHKRRAVDADQKNEKPIDAFMQKMIDEMIHG